MAKVKMPSSRKGKLVAVAGGLLGLCVVFGCLSTVLFPASETPPQTSDVADRAAAPVPLDTPTEVVLASSPVPSVEPTRLREEPTDTPVPAPTSAPIPTATAVPVTGPSANTNANLRAGPGTTFAVVGSVQPGERLEIVGRTAAGDWLQLATGLWIASRLVNDPPSVPVVEIPTAPPAEPTATSAPEAPPAPDGPSTISDVRLAFVINRGQEEVLVVRNAGQGVLDIGGWELRGSIGDDFCIIPGETVLQPNESFQVATGDSQVTGRGFKCGDKPIWNNEGEIIFLIARDGQRIQIRT